MILWQRAATAPDRGSILGSLASEAAAGRTEEGRSQSEAECPETREPWPWGFKVEIDIQISAETEKPSGAH